MKIKIKKLREDAIIPAKKTEGAVGYDLAMPCDVLVNEVRQVIPLGFALELPAGVEAKIEPRSGFSAKGIEGVYASIKSCASRFNADILVGKIDPDYRGEVGLIILNHEPDKRFIIKAGTRVAQMTFYRVAETQGFDEVQELTDTARGSGGFGHTGSY